MSRTFHHRFTIGSKCGVVLLAALALYLFWVKAVIFGMVVVILNVLVMERVLHSEYVFRDGFLEIRRGRFSKRRLIPLVEITSCRPMTTTFGMVRYLLIGYGNGRYAAVQPEQEASFVQFLKSRLADDEAPHDAGEVS